MSWLAPYIILGLMGLTWAAAIWASFREEESPFPSESEASSQHRKAA